MRARIDVLSEVPTEWRAALNRWSRLNRKHKTTLDGALAPHRNDAYLIYQTLLGTWPLTHEAGEDRARYVERIQEYAVKAVREAAQRTNWLNPNEAYEHALTRFIAGILDPRRSRAFLDDFVGFHARLIDAGLVNALSQQLLKLTAPGVPDIYQGTELWDDSLVDPDNRRPVDFTSRTAILKELDGGTPPERAAELFAHRADGRLKLHVTHRALAARRACPALFAEGDYLALTVTGELASHVVAFSRRHGDQGAIIVVPRLITSLIENGGLSSETWGDTRVELPPSVGGRYQNVFTRECYQTGEQEGQATSLLVGELFRVLPLSLLTREGRGVKDA